MDTRERLGDREADTVLSKQGSGMLVTLAERKSRLYLIRRVEGEKASLVRDAVIDILKPYKSSVHTITFDNGVSLQSIKRLLKGSMQRDTLPTLISHGSEV